MAGISTVFSRGSRGSGKIFIAVLIAIVAVTVYVGSQIGPVYNDKWKFEDYMEETVRRLYAIEEEGIFELLDNFAVDNDLDVRPYEDCKFEGDLGKPGHMDCNYEVVIEFPGYTYVMQVNARYETTRIPTVSH